MAKAHLLCAVLLSAVLLPAACSSQPEMERQYVERPESTRPEGVTPSGLTDYRDTLAEQRSITREQENAVLLTPNALSAQPTMPWYDTWLNTVADVMKFIRNF